MKLISLFMIIAGSSIIIIWTIEIIKGKFNGQGNFFQWKNEANDRMWPHISAEFITGSGLILSSILLFTETDQAETISLFFLGSLAYTSLNSSAWAFSERSRIVYLIPMTFCLIGSIISLLFIL